MPSHLQQVDVAPERIARWRTAAEALGEHGHALRLELESFVLDPTRHLLRRAARAARLAEKHLTGDAALIANATACELENDADGAGA